MTSSQTETNTNISIVTQCGSHVQNTELAVNYFRAYINPLLTVVGVLGNVTALYLFSTHRPWNRFAIYAMALAISDSLVLISNTFLDDFLGRGLYFLSDSKWIIKLDTYSVEACRTMELIGTWFVFTSGSLLVAFSLDRVACMCRPLQCRSNDGIRVALMVSILIAVLGFALSLPQAMLYQLVYRPPKMIVDPRLISRDLRNANASQMNVNGGKFIIKPHYNSCTLNPNKFSNGNEILPFIFSTLFTYMLPCVLLLLTNMVIAYQLARLHTRRRLLRNTKDTDKHINTWRTGSDAKPREVASSSVTLNPTVASILQRRRTTVLENRREAYRVIALLILSGLYLCFTCPVSITISIRASLSPESPPCRLLFYAHLTRLLTSVKDINYALNGYIYAFFFQFYRVRLLALFTCGQLNLNKQSRSTPMSAYSPTEQNPLDSPGTWSPAENTARSVHPSKNRADCADD